MLINQGTGQLAIQRRAGSVLVLGAVTAPTLLIPRNPVVLVTRTVNGGAPGRLRYSTTLSTITDGIPQEDGDITVTSSNGADDGTVDILDWYPGADPVQELWGQPYGGLNLEGGNVPVFQNGSATLVAGAIQVTGRYIDASSFIAVTRTAFGGALGFERVDTRVNGNGTGSFFIRSSNAGDTSTFSWLVISGLAGL